jgi:cyclopropane-fatty-acyl-phospholipid synthase
VSRLLDLGIGLTERGWVPDAVIRQAIRGLLKARLAGLPLADPEALAELENAFVAGMDTGPIALVPERANEQHYEVPAAFFGEVLGPRRKYSACLWPDAGGRLEQAEEAALAATCERAGIADGQQVLELGCGWGSLTLWIAERYPGCRVTAVSNSRPQRAHIAAVAEQHGLGNLEVVVADMNAFATDRRFDRVVSVEMFEHMRNWRALFARVHGWLEPGGRFFQHVFCHRAAPYEFLDQGPSDWMTRHFFAGGIMPSDDLPLRFQDHLRLVARWRWSGRHYARTLEAWLARMDARRERVWPVLEATYGPREVLRWWVRWRIFFMACAELFAWDQGREWYVAHYLFERPAR